MKIAIGSDHAGFKYKNMISMHLRQQGYAIVDMGTDSVEACDYPDFIKQVTAKVASGDCELGIVLGGSGNGEAITANKTHGIRCALCWDEYTAQLCKEHNNANMISIGERTVSAKLALKIVDIWLSAKFAGGRHLRRINKIEL